MYGEMASVVTASQRMVARRAQELGYKFAHPELDGALPAALGGS
jgi:NAD dependent epimerase/dehydratase family enzyme